MAESVLAYIALLALMGYGFYRVAMTVIREQEDRRRESELAWQRDGL